MSLIRKSFYCLFIIFNFIIVLLFTNGCTYKKEYKNLSDQDQKSVVDTINNYYYSLEKGFYLNALYFIDFTTKQRNLNIELEQRNFALNELSINNNYQLKLLSFDKKITNIKDSDVYFVTVEVLFKYKGMKDKISNEVLYLKKNNDNWKIVKIESCDRYVILRANEYTYGKLLEP